MTQVSASMCGKCRAYLSGNLKLLWQSKKTQRDVFGHGQIREKKHENLSS